MPISLLAMQQTVQPAHADDAMLRSAIVNVANYYLRMAKDRAPAEMEAITWQNDSIDGADHGQWCAAFASLTLELAAQVVGRQSWVTGGTSYPWPLQKWADVRVDPNPASLGIISIRQDAAAHDRWHPLGEGYEPLPGDWVLFHGHVEVVRHYSGGVLTTVGGDSSPDFSVNAHEYLIRSAHRVSPDSSTTARCRVPRARRRIALRPRRVASRRGPACTSILGTIRGAMRATGQPSGWRLSRPRLRRPAMPSEPRQANLVAPLFQQRARSHPAMARTGTRRQASARSDLDMVPMARLCRSGLFPATGPVRTCLGQALPGRPQLPLSPQQRVPQPSPACPQLRTGTTLAARIHRRILGTAGTIRHPRQCRRMT
jgi:hypothetical protein